MSPLMATGGYGIASGKAYTFLREIQPYTRYQIETRFAAWDSRWVRTLPSPHTHFSRS